MTRAEFERLLAAHDSDVLDLSPGGGNYAERIKRAKESRVAVLAAFDEAMRGTDGK